MTWHRRDLLRAGALAAAGVCLPRAAWARSTRVALPPDPDLLRRLASRALEAATAAGARHAEVRLSHLRNWELMEMVGNGGGVTGIVSNGIYGDWVDHLAIGVRALVGGSWGWASSTRWTLEEAARLGTDAVAQARTTARAGAPPVTLVPAPVVVDGRWATPLARDPFTVSRLEILDTIAGTSYVTLRDWGVPTLQVSLTRLETAFASTEGSFLTQVRHATGASIGVRGRPPFRDHQPVGSLDQFEAYALPLAGRGWEYVGRAPWYEIGLRIEAAQAEDLALPLKPLDVGRYDVVFDQRSTARLLSGTLGCATELDRAMGEEANAGGTSYLRDPAGMLGTEAVAAAGITVTANRSLEGGLATVRWDEEGVAPAEFPLVTDGVLTGFQTTRESAAWLPGAPARSHGCAGGATALDATQLQRPNLRLTPGRESAGLPDLVRGMRTGIVVEHADLSIDFNASDGMTMPDEMLQVTRMYEVQGGRRVARLQSAAVLFRAPELWKAVLALGGPASVEPIPVRMRKGEPAQETWHTVEAPPMLVRQLAVIDPLR